MKFVVALPLILAWEIGAFAYYGQRPEWHEAAVWPILLAVEASEHLAQSENAKEARRK